MVDEPTPSLKIDAEDQVSHRKKSSPPSETAKSSGGFSSFLIFLLAVVAVAASAMLYIQLQATNAQLADAEAEQDTARMRIEALEEKLQITDASVSKSKSAADDKLSELDTEIRKLWDNVWKKSKAQLAEHETSIAQLKKDVAGSKGVASELAALKKSLAAAEKDLGGVSAQVNGMKAQVKEALEKSSANRGEMASLELSVQGADARSNAAQSKVEDALKRLAAIEQQVAENAEWVESINNHRRQVVRDIQELRQKMQDYQASPY